MTETPELQESIPETTTRAPERKHRSNRRIYQAAAWVGIVAGTLFIVGSVFFTGYVLGRHGSGGHYRGHGEMSQRYQQLRPMGPGGPGREMGPGGPGREKGPGGPEREMAPNSAPENPPAPRAVPLVPPA